VRTFKHKRAVISVDKITHDEIVSCSSDKTIKYWMLNNKFSIKTIDCDRPLCLKAISSCLIVCAHFHHNNAFSL